MKTIQFQQFISSYSKAHQAALQNLTYSRTWLFYAGLY